MLIIDISSLVIIYLISFFGSQVDSGVKFLFLLLLFFIIELFVIYIELAFITIVTTNPIVDIIQTFTVFNISPTISMFYLFIISYIV